MKDCPNRSLISSFNHAIEGIIYVLRTQRNMKIHFFIAAAVLIASLFFRISRLEFMVLLFAIVLVMITELINTAIEFSIDVVTTTFDPLAKVAKDIAAAAVLLASLNAVILGYFIFFNRFNPYALTILQKIRNAPVHVTCIAILLVVLLVIAVKALFGERNFLRGGLPSGHSALAGALFCAIAFISGNALVASLGLLLALLVFHSRAQARIHSYLEIVIGAILGILITILIFQLI
ncbi:MAG TPA: diacylglycerol kinase [Actinobacteria bacterium]|nr:diacylglycerol kinase [Actinomycetota bacterium]